MPYSDKNYSVNNINYLNKDFLSLKNTLMEYAKTYFPNTYQDFNETSPGMMLIEMGAYVGDVLSFYIDQQYKEMLLPLAEERKNVINIARMLGYKTKAKIPSHTEITVTQTVSADVSNLNNIIPNYGQALVIDKGMKLSSTSNSSIVFETLEEVDFTISSSNYEPQNYDYNNTTKLVSNFILKRKVKAISGETKTISFTLSTPKKFLELNIPDKDVIEILTVIDSNNNKWYEVEHLAQDSIPIENHYTSDWVSGAYVSETSERSSAYVDIDNNVLDVPIPYSLQYVRSTKRFTSRVNDDNSTSLIFGPGLLTGNKIDQTSYLQSDQAGIFIPGDGSSAMTDPIDPLNSDSSITLGETPANTTLTITYRAGGGVNSNLPSGDILTIETQNVLNGLSTSGKNLKVINEIPAIGGTDEQTVEEIRNNALSFFASQDRCVTKEDYEARVLNMPAKFGNIAKVYVEKAAYTTDGVNMEGITVIPGSNLTRTVDSLRSYLSEVVVSNESGAPLPMPEEYFNFDETNDIIDQTDVSFLTNLENDFEVSDPFGNLNNPNSDVITNINIHLLAYDTNKRLVTLSPNSGTTHPLKSNIKEYLNNYRIITDEINLMDGKVINFGIAFRIISTRDANKQDVKLRCIDKIKEYFSIDKMQFRQPIYTSDLEYELMGLNGVRAIDYVELTQNFNQLSNGKTLSLTSNTLLFDIQHNQDGGINQYSAGESDLTGNVHDGIYGWMYDFTQFYGVDKSGIILPSYDPSVFELKNPNENIKGIVV